MSQLDHMGARRGQDVRCGICGEQAESHRYSGWESYSGYQLYMCWPCAATMEKLPWLLSRSELARQVAEVARRNPKISQRRLNSVVLYVTCRGDDEWNSGATFIRPTG